MKLEPVAWMTHESSMRLKDGGNCKGAVPVHQQQSHASSIPLYAIPEGYVVVPVSLLKRVNAAMMEWAAKYGEHNPQWLPPARVSELSAEIEAMIAAKEQS